MWGRVTSPELDSPKRLPVNLTAGREDPQYAPTLFPNQSYLELNPPPDGLDIGIVARLR